MSILRSALVASLLWSVPCTTTAGAQVPHAVFMRIKGAKQGAFNGGSLKSIGHGCCKDDFEIDTVSAGGPIGAGSGQSFDVTIDLTGLPSIMEALINGENITTVDFLFFHVQRNGKDTIDYTVQAENSRITSVSVGAGSSGGWKAQFTIVASKAVMTDSAGKGVTGPFPTIYHHAGSGGQPAKGHELKARFVVDGSEITVPGLRAEAAIPPLTSVAWNISAKTSGGPNVGVLTLARNEDAVTSVLDAAAKRGAKLDGTTIIWRGPARTGQIKDDFKLTLSSASFANEPAASGKSYGVHVSHFQFQDVTLNKVAAW